MTAIAAPDPVVLLIDEIDKTDQEFEAMLLELLSDFQITIPELGRGEAGTPPLALLTSNNTREVIDAAKRRCLYLWLAHPNPDQEFEAMLLELLSDFQITIPELGRVEARTHPVVLLTSNNTRELTEALKRRCLYLWLDYPDAEQELEIVRLHAPGLPETVARRLVEIIGMVRELDLKKPPSIAESIDWARALLLLGADDISADVFRSTMSIIVKHRTDLDTVAERVGVRLGTASRAA